MKSGNVKLLEQKVKDGASVNEVDSTRDRFTPMHWACYKGALEVYITPNNIGDLHI